MTRVPWITQNQLKPRLKAPQHNWLRFECTRCGGTYLGPPNPQGSGLVAFVRVHSKCEEKPEG